MTNLKIYARLDIKFDSDKKVKIMAKDKSEIKTFLIVKYGSLKEAGKVWSEKVEERMIAEHGSTEHAIFSWFAEKFSDLHLGDFSPEEAQVIIDFLMKELEKDFKKKSQ